MHDLVGDETKQYLVLETLQKEVIGSGEKVSGGKRYNHDVVIILRSCASIPDDSFCYNMQAKCR